jgi:hypothetical protein
MLLARYEFAIPIRVQDSVYFDHGTILKFTYRISGNLSRGSTRRYAVIMRQLLHHLC